MRFAGVLREPCALSDTSLALDGDIFMSIVGGEEAFSWGKVAFAQQMTDGGLKDFDIPTSVTFGDSFSREKPSLRLV